MEPALYLAYFPVVEVSQTSNILWSVSAVLMIASFFPLVCWSSVLFAPLAILLSPFFVGASSLMNFMNLVIIIPVYFILVFIAIFGEIILIPWSMLSLPMLGVGVLVRIIAEFV